MKFTEECIKRVLEPYKNEFGLSLIMTQPVDEVIS